ncbi:hypothetical protein GPECTOR_145g740 [Gonium pectorale]|uniref:BTB domain-containing protein n=1 Tax=Gonium pectorale TaxID=33097 RepID=A0A150FXX0_GONPE|nr:hypothetical protein GPECTOR_145g740 [Gonium pectorale]|eukprot:KXZ42449.1 hypothetical protein GPECTOR_145g740 [Gonium pectorale]
MRVQILAATKVTAVITRPLPVAAPDPAPPDPAPAAAAAADSAPPPGRPRPQPRTQVLVFCAFGVCPLTLPDGGEDGANADAEGRRGAPSDAAAAPAAAAAALGEPLHLTGYAAAHVTKAAAADYDPHSDSVVVAVPGGLLSLGRDNRVSILAGDPDLGPAAHPRDGLGDDASVARPFRVAAGGPPPPPPEPSPGGAVVHFMEHGAGGAAAADGAGVALRRAQRLGDAFAIITLARPPNPGGGLVRNRVTGELLLPDTPRSLCRLLPLGGLEPAAGAGQEQSHEPRDGPPRRARFASIKALAADEHGNTFVLDDREGDGAGGGEGEVVTLERGLLEGDAPADCMAVLPGGRLVVWRSGGPNLAVLTLDAWTRGLLAGGAAAAGLCRCRLLSGAEGEAEGRRKRPRCGCLAGCLVADLGALLDGGQAAGGGEGGGGEGGGGGGVAGDGAAGASRLSDVTLVAGGRGSGAASGGSGADAGGGEGGEAEGGEGGEGEGGGDGSGRGGGGGGNARRSFPAHRAILAARCPYFRRLFAGGFADSAAPRVELRGAEPEALAAVLCHLYTGDPGDLAEGLLRPVAELADRLLLPELRDHVAARLVRSVTPGTVVDGMLWADRAGAGMEGLLRRLAAYFAAHRAEVAAQAPGGLDELVFRPSLFLLELPSDWAVQLRAQLRAGLAAGPLRDARRRLQDSLQASAASPPAQGPAAAAASPAAAGGEGGGGRRGGGGGREQRGGGGGREREKEREWDRDREADYGYGGSAGLVTRREADRPPSSVGSAGDAVRGGGGGGRGRDRGDPAGERVDRGGYTGCRDRDFGDRSGASGGRERGERDNRERGDRGGRGRGDRGGGGGDETPAEGAGADDSGPPPGLAVPQ